MTLDEFADAVQELANGAYWMAQRSSNGHTAYVANRLPHGWTDRHDSPEKVLDQLCSMPTEGAETLRAAVCDAAERLDSAQADLESAKRRLAEHEARALGDDHGE